ncbi:MAG: hypothetical protein EZS28_006360 [Streblomastix strix]|uniref:Uncharacterized protein n=1 Tax=Streblomastix strix TaxID=222440 RepID=A0A5J4WTI3_9EUKA|nr:MAG: hypothetical protein EZS28_006360 [Streblomastix strix]
MQKFKPNTNARSSSASRKLGQARRLESKDSQRSNSKQTQQSSGSNASNIRRRNKDYELLNKVNLPSEVGGGILLGISGGAPKEGATSLSARGKKHDYTIDKEEASDDITEKKLQVLNQKKGVDVDFDVISNRLDKLEKEIQVSNENEENLKLKAIEQEQWHQSIQKNKDELIQHKKQEQLKIKQQQQRIEEERSVIKEERQKAQQQREEELKQKQRQGLEEKYDNLDMVMQYRHKVQIKNQKLAKVIDEQFYQNLDYKKQKQGEQIDSNKQRALHELDEMESSEKTQLKVLEKLKKQELELIQQLEDQLEKEEEAQQRYNDAIQLGSTLPQTKT